MFTLEDLYGLKVIEANGEVYLRLENINFNYDATIKMLSAWQKEAAKLEAREISKEEYDKWRYRYPEFDTTQRWAKVPSQELSDLLVKELDK